MSVGQPVRRGVQTGSDKKWIEGTCLGRVATRSYKVQTKLGTFRRNRQMIRSAPDLENYCVTPSLYKDESTTDLILPKIVADLDRPNRSQSSASMPGYPVADQGSSSVGPYSESGNLDCKSSSSDVAETSEFSSSKRSVSGRVIRIPTHYRHDLC